MSYGESYNGNQFVPQFFTGASTISNPTITWVTDSSGGMCELPAATTPDPDDPIAWLKGRVQETIDEVDWQEYKAA